MRIRDGIIRNVHGDIVTASSEPRPLEWNDGFSIGPGDEIAQPIAVDCPVSDDGSGGELRPRFQYRCDAVRLA